MSKFRDLNYVVTSKELLPLAWNYAETLEEAETVKARYIDSLHEDVALFKDYAIRYDKDYWEARLKSAERALESIMVLSWADFQEAIRKHYLEHPNEITAEKFEEMLDVLPPIYWCTIDGVEMFCMSEMEYGTYTNQYAHDKRTGKYWHARVDCRNKETWLHKFLRKGA